MKKIKVAIIMGPFLPVPPKDGGAVEKLWFNLSKELVDKNIEIIQVSKIDDSFPDIEIIDKVKHIRVKGYDSVNSYIQRLSLDFIYAFRAINKVKNVNIIITNTFWAPILAKIFTKSKIWVSAHRFPKKQYFLYKNVDLIQAVSSSVAKGIIKQEPKIKDLVKVIPNFINFEDNEIKLSSKKKTILYVGRVHPEKGIEYLIKAYNLLDEDLKIDWSLKIIGPHEEKYGGGGEIYMKKLKKLSSSNVIYTGPIFNKKQLNDEYISSSVFVYPSIATGEAFGLAPLEAMSFGCQTIVSNLDCFNDFMNNENGFFYEHDISCKNLSKLLSEAINRHGTKEHEKILNASLMTAKKFDIKSVSKLFKKEIKRLNNEI